MTFSELIDLIRWDWRINHGVSFDVLRARLLLLEVRLEQYVYHKFYRPSSPLALIWYLFRFTGSVFQCSCATPTYLARSRSGGVLWLPHPQNIILAGYADIGNFCTIYHNVSIAWNGFMKTKPLSPKIGDCADWCRRNPCGQHHDWLLRTDRGWYCCFPFGSRSLTRDRRSP